MLWLPWVCLPLTSYHFQEDDTGQAWTQSQIQLDTLTQRQGGQRERGWSRGGLGVLGIVGGAWLGHICYEADGNFPQCHLARSFPPMMP